MTLAHPTILYAPDDNGGGDAAKVDAGAGTGKDKTADAAGAKVEKTADDQKSGDEKRFTQAELDKIVQDRLARADEKAKREAEKAKKEAELAQLAEKQEFQTLAQKRQEQIVELEEQVKELDGLKERVQKYETALTGYRDELVKGVPDNVRALLNGLDIADQLNWLAENAAQFNGGKTPLPQTPNQNGAGTMTAEEKRRQAYTPRF